MFSPVVLDPVRMMGVTRDSGTTIFSGSWSCSANRNGRHTASTTTCLRDYSSPQLTTTTATRCPESKLKAAGDYNVIPCTCTRHLETGTAAAGVAGRNIIQYTGRLEISGRSGGLPQHVYPYSGGEQASSSGWSGSLAHPPARPQQLE